MHILFFIFLTYIYVYSLVLCFTTDYILYNWVRDE